MSRERIKLNQHYQQPDGGRHYYQGPPPPPPGHYAPPAAAYPPPPSEPPKKKRKWPWVVGGLFALMVISSIANGGNRTSAPAVSTTPQASSQSATSQATQPQAQAPAAASGPDLSQGIPDGQYIVGDEVAPGRYKSPGAQSGIFDLCSVTTRSANGDVLEWKTGNEGDQVLITVSEKADTIEIHGCEPFQKVQ